MLFDVVLFGILSCDLLVTVSLFESNLKVPKQDGVSVVENRKRVFFF